MRRRATIRDVATLAGVHPATVSRALDPDRAGRVTAATVERVRDAARRLGYAPDPIARTLRSQRGSVIGVLVPDLGNPVFPPIVGGIEDGLAEAGYVALVAQTGNDPARERQQLEALQRRRCEGVVVATATVDDRSVADLVASGYPTVLVNRRVDGVEAASVGSDDRTGVRLAVEHLAGLGHRHISHLTGPADLSVVRTRAEAFLSSMRDLGLGRGPGSVIHCPTLDTAGAAEAARRLLSHRPGGDGGVSAIVAGNDLMALGCYAAADAAGLACPADISVVGYNDMPLVGWWRPALTTVRIPQYEIGREAAALLLEQVRAPGAPPARHVTLPVGWVERSSTGPPPGPCPPQHL